MVVVIAFEVVGRWSRRAAALRQKLRAGWKPALGIALVYLVAALYSGQDVLTAAVMAAAVFCQALIGLALARDVRGFEPLPVTRAIRRWERPWRSTGWMIGISVLLVPVSLAIGFGGLQIGEHLFNEVRPNVESMEAFSGGAVQAFFMFLSGAGIAEEIVYRLVLLCLFWRLTRRAHVAVFLSALLMGAYHLTPLTSMQDEFLTYPVSQFLAAFFISVLWGYVFIRRGFETVVLTHTLTDWAPIPLGLLSTTG